MPTYRVVNRTNFLELLVLRRAMGVRKTCATMTRVQESQLYKSLISVSGWSTISADYDVVHPSTFRDVRKHRERDMHHIITSFKINDEPSDKTTQEVMHAMSTLPQNRRARRMLASICATINGPRFLNAFLKNVAGLTRLQLYDRARRIINSSGASAKLFTRSFNVQAHYRKNHKPLALMRLEDAKRATKTILNMRAVKRKDLQLSLVKCHGLLLGKNTYAYIERSYRTCGFATTGSDGCGRSGSVMGPGAQGGANVLFGDKYKQEQIGTSFADAVSGYHKSTRAFRRLRKELRGIIRQLRKKLKKDQSAIKRGRVVMLVEAAEQLLNATDCEQQFLLCELGKVSAIVLNESSSYRRDAGMGDGDSDDDIGNTDTESSENSD